MSFKDWNLDDVRRYNERVMKTAKQHNAELTGETYDDYSPAQSPIIEQTVRNESLAAAKGKAGNAVRISVRVESVRTRLIDPDNLAGKYFVDCLRYCGLLRGDSAKEIDYKITQRKPKKGESEGTKIMLEK